MKEKPDSRSRSRKIEIEEQDGPDTTSRDGLPGGDPGDDEAEFRFEDRRHWVHPDEAPDAADEGVAPRQPTMIDEYRGRAEAAEKKLQEYIEAFKGFRREQDDFRERMKRDVDRRVGLQFATLVNGLLEAVDNLDLALEHAAGVPQAEPLARGVELARKRFLDGLEQNGVEKVFPQDREFDPNEAEAMRVDPVDDPQRSGKVTEVLRPGYKLGEQVIRPARVAVGRYEPS